MTAAEVHDCSIDTPPAGWPPLQVLALFPPIQPGAAPALVRASAQGMARQVLMQRAGAETPAQWQELPRAARGARSVSFSHEAGASLLAWCATGAIGVDLVDLDSLALASQQELAATAALYLGPIEAAAVAAAPQASEARLRFAVGWASLEARLKCLGLELDEWQSARADSLDSTAVVQVFVPDRDAQISGRWIGCAAWWADPQRRSVQ
ncbi:MAG: 4'-phosphopantetheinyl transferase superfamily protein [Ideonella sp.]